MNGRLHISYVFDDKPLSFKLEDLVQKYGCDIFIMESAHTVTIEYPNGFQVIKDRDGVFGSKKLLG